MTVRDPNATSVLEDAPEFTRQKPGGVFLVIKGPDRGEQVVLQGSTITFGSAPGCDLVLSDRTVSRRHATASLEGGQVIVRDLSSTNGSFTHGSRFKEITISHGAEVKLGKTVLKFLPQEEVVQPQGERRRSTFGHLSRTRRSRCGGCSGCCAISRPATPRCSSRARPAPARS